MFLFLDAGETLAVHEATEPRRNSGDPPAARSSLTAWKGGWGVYGLVMPSGDAMPYDGATVDTFADWNGLIRGVPVGELWPKVHPGFSINETLANLDKVRSVHDVSISRIEAVVSPSAAK